MLPTARTQSTRSRTKRPTTARFPAGDTRSGLDGSPGPAWRSWSSAVATSTRRRARRCPTTCRRRQRCKWAHSRANTTTTAWLPEGDRRRLRDAARGPATHRSSRTVRAWRSVHRWRCRTTCHRRQRDDWRDLMLHRWMYSVFPERHVPTRARRAPTIRPRRARRARPTQSTADAGDRTVVVRSAPARQMWSGQRSCGAPNSARRQPSARESAAHLAATCAQYPRCEPDPQSERRSRPMSRTRAECVSSPTAM